MKLLFVFLQAVVVLVGCAGGTYAQRDTLVPNCSGNAADDTAAISAMARRLGTTNPGTIRFPYKTDPSTICKVNDVTFSDNVSLDLTEGGVQIASGKTLRANGQVTAPDLSQVFFNALFGQGTVVLAKGTVARPQWWGAKGDGAADDTQAIRAAVKSVPGGVVLLSAGMFIITNTISLAVDGTQLVGSGFYTSVLLCNPTRETPCIDIKAPPNAMVSFVGVRNLGLLSTSPVTKEGIRITDGTEVFIENVKINGFTSKDKESIGLELRGRQVQAFRNVTITADRPISIEDDPNTVYDIDHYHFENLYLIADTGQPCISVASGVNLSHVTIDGYQAWIQCKHGFYYKDSNTTNISFALTIKNARWEQNIDDTGYFIFVSHNTNLDGIILENLYGGGVHGRGLYFRKVRAATITNFQYQGTLEGLNADASDTHFIFLNPVWESATFTLTGFKYFDSLPAGIFSRIR